MTALFLAGCGSPRTTVGGNTSLDRAIALYIDGDFQRAEVLLTQITRGGGADEEVAAAYLYLGRIYLARGDYEKATDAFSAGRTLGGDIRFTEYFEEARRHLTGSPRRIVQLPRITRAQLAGLIEDMFGSRLVGCPGTGEIRSPEQEPGIPMGSDGGQGTDGSVNGVAARRGERAIDCVLQAGVMTVLPDGDFHAADEVTAPAFYAVVQRLARVLGAEGDVGASLFPGGFRGATGRGGGEGERVEGEGGTETGGGDAFVSGREAHRILVALAAACGSGSE